MELCVSSNSWKLRKTAMDVQVSMFFKQCHIDGVKIKQEPADNMGSKSIKVEEINQVEQILLHFCDDCDDRIRTIAAEHLASVIPYIEAPHRTLYAPLCELLDDACANVRVRGLRLIHAIAESHAEMLVPGPNKNADIRLVDDAFSRLCNSMHDISVEVRIEAAKLLGSMCEVSEKFLMQTLDKKLMHQLKFLKNADRYSNYCFPSEWSNGRTFGEDTAVEKIDDDLAALIPSGACGAFVTGLEDEYLAVRNASIDAVCHLSQQSTAFANKALDFLADMFNDEIEEVRLNAIKSLRRLCQGIVLKEAQIETILSALDDASADSRYALRDLLSTCTLHSVSCLKSTMDALLNNLKRYPRDKLSIWNCAVKLGLNHPSLVQPLVAELLDYQPFFDLPEPSIDDAFYICKLLLVLNAASRCPTIKSIFLPHTWRHYDYLRNSNPQLTPSLEPFNDDSVDEKSYALIESLGRNTQNMLRMAMSADKESMIELIKLALRNLDRICKYTQSDRARFTFLRLFYSSLLNLHSALPFLNITDNDKVTNGSSMTVFKQIYADTFRMETLWNLDSSCYQSVLALRLKLLYHLALFNDKARPTVDVVASQLKRSIHGISDDEPVRFCEDTEFSDVIQMVDIRLNQALDAQENLTEKSIEITEPNRESERVLRFVADLVAAVPFACTFRYYNPMDFDNLRIMLSYPDGRQSYQRVRRSQVKEISEATHRLRTDAFISDVVWTDVSIVELSLIYVIPAHFFGVFDNKNYISLCDPIPVRVYPKARF